MRLGYNVDVHTVSYCWGLTSKTPITHIFPLSLRSSFRCSPSRAVPKGRLCFGGPRARGVRGLVEGCWEKWYPYCTLCTPKVHWVRASFCKTAILGMICPSFWRPCLGRHLRMRQESFVVREGDKLAPAPDAPPENFGIFKSGMVGKPKGTHPLLQGTKRAGFAIVTICYYYHDHYYHDYYHDYHILS